jgi:hypothetical protein
MATRTIIKAKAQKSGMTRGSTKWRSRTLASENTCSCHPKQYGLKKGLRRARRRVDKVLVRETE